MAFQTTIGAGVFSALAVHANEVTAVPADQAAYEALFADAADYVEMPNVRDFPDAMGTPPNIVKVPEYGRKTTLSIGAQPDAPDFEITVNYIAADWAPGSTLKDFIDNKTSTVFQFSLLYAKPADLTTTPTGLGSQANSNFYFLGRMESIQINPSREDANTATIAVSLLGDFEGPFTVD